jgi:hypothetical protein
VSCPLDATRLGDGHNRYEMYTRLGGAFETIDTENCPTREAAIAWIVANQLGRRNLTPSQKAALALELEKQLAIEAKKKEAERKSTLQRIEKSPLPVVHAAEQAAKMVGANRQYVSDAKKIEQDAPEVLEHVKQGTLSIPQAKKVVALPAEERSAAIERMRQGKPVALC